MSTYPICVQFWACTRLTYHYKTICNTNFSIISSSSNTGNMNAFVSPKTRRNFHFHHCIFVEFRSRLRGRCRSFRWKRRPSRQHDPRHPHPSRPRLGPPLLGPPAYRRPISGRPCRREGSGSGRIGTRGPVHP
jgi:hypothetical protein